jgi:hypothetical protein
MLSPAAGMGKVGKDVFFFAANIRLSSTMNWNFLNWPDQHIFIRK